MGQEINQTVFEEETFREYERRLANEARLLQTMLAEERFSDAGLIGGYELESWLLDHNYFPSPINQAFLSRLNNPLVVPELSRFNVELNGAPFPLRDGALSAMAGELGNTWQQCQEVAHQLDSVLLMIGILPTIRQNDLCLSNMSDLKRYRALNEQVFKRRSGKPLCIEINGRERLKIDHPDVMLEAATTSFQLHLQCPQRSAVRYFNASIVAAGPLLAAAGNSPLAFGADLWDETRIPLFEQSVEIGDHATPENRRVSFGRDYVHESLFECFNDNLATHSVLLPILMDDGPERFAHLRLHNGTIWRWVRPLIGFDADGTPHMRIEQRVLPSGPTITDMFANAALYFGLTHFLASLKEAPESELPFEKARSNFYASAQYGLDAKLTWLDGSETNARTLLLEEILPMARHGLKSLQVDDSDIDFFIGIVQARIHTGQTGSSWLRAFLDKHNTDALHLVAAYLEQQRRGIPVHEWEI